MEGKRPAPARGPTRRAEALAWVALLVLGLIFYLLVVVAGARAPSVTPFLTAAAGTAGGAAVGLATLALRPALRLTLVKRVAAVAVAFALVATAGGGIRYTYGAAGDLKVGITFFPNSIKQGADASFEGDLALLNVGSTTVRVYPHFELLVADPSGTPLPTLWQNCSRPVASSPHESDLLEVAPGSILEWHFTLPVAWSLTNGQPPNAGATLCGALILEVTGNHTMTGVFTSAPFDAVGQPPVWTGRVASDPLPFVVR